MKKPVKQLCQECESEIDERARKSAYYGHVRHVVNIFEDAGTHVTHDLLLKLTGHKYIRF